MEKLEFRSKVLADGAELLHEEGHITIEEYKLILQEEAETFQGTRYGTLLEEKLEVLEEGISIGGMKSYIKRYFTGKDDDIEDQIISQLRKVKSEKDRDELLEEIDEVIYNSRSMSNAPVVTARILAGGLISGIWTAVNRGNGKVADFHQGLKKLKAEVKKYKIPKS